MQDWIILPSSDLTKRENWQNPEPDRYAALRARILVNKSRINDEHVSPIIEQHHIAPNDTITLNWRREQMVSEHSTIQESIRLSLTRRVFNKLASTISTEFATKAPGFSGKFRSSLVAENETEIIEGLEHTLSGTKSFTLQEVKEEGQIIEMKGASEKRVAQLRYVLWPHIWDVYLHSIEYLELTHKSHLWGWIQTRKTIKRIPDTEVKLPLYRIRFYQPQPRPSVFYTNSLKEVADPSSIEVTRLTDPSPPGKPPSGGSLDNLAKAAFPISKEERRAAARRKAARKAAAKKATARKPAAKKKVAKKVTARKPVAARKKAAAKRPAAKRAVKKPVAARKAAAKRPAATKIKRARAT